METVQNKFRVIAVSTNTNSFGLHRFIAVAKSGEAYALHTGTIYKPNKGDDIVIEQFITESGRTSFKEVKGMGIEMPEKMPVAPKEVLMEIFGEA